MFHENPSSGCGDVPCGRTDRHDEANSRFSHLANASKHASILNATYQVSHNAYYQIYQHPSSPNTLSITLDYKSASIILRCFRIRW